MAKQRRTLATAALPDGSRRPSSLDDDVLEAIMHAARARRALGALATVDKQLCRLARRIIPVCLCIRNAYEARLMLHSQTGSDLPFTQCTLLELVVRDNLTARMAPDVLHTAGQWPEMTKMELTVYPVDGEQRRPRLTVPMYESNLLSWVSNLQQLRSLALALPAFGARCARHMAQLQHLTKLSLDLFPGVAHAAADLTALSAMTNLVELDLSDPPAVQPADEPYGPYCLPSSLVRLRMEVPSLRGLAASASWSTHLPGCPQLQHLELGFLEEMPFRSSAKRLVRLLADHTPQLRSLKLLPAVTAEEDGGRLVLPVAAWLYEEEWRPNCCLAELQELECLEAAGLLWVGNDDDWEVLAQLTALTRLAGLEVGYVPDWHTPMPQALQELEDAEVFMGGADIAHFLLTLPALQRASVINKDSWRRPLVPAPAQPPLPRHPSLKEFKLKASCRDAPAAAAQFAHLAPVVSGVSELRLLEWPHGRSRDGWGGGIGQAGSGLPDLSACTELSRLTFQSVITDDSPVTSRQQLDFLAMLAPLAQLQQLDARCAPLVDDAAVLLLRTMRPRLQVKLTPCIRQGQGAAARFF